MNRIQGTWFEFSHHSKIEGTYWDKKIRSYTEEDWRNTIREMAQAGMSYLVLLASSLCYEDYAYSYFPGGPYPFPEDFICKNPIEVLMDEADRCQIKVFMSCGYYGNLMHARDNMRDPDVTERAFLAMEQLYRLYSHHASFYGWYLPDETGIDETGFPEFFIDYVNIYRKKARSIDATKTLLIAPYGIARVLANEHFIDQLSRLDCDFIAYQDGIGVLHTKLEDSAACYKALRAAHDAANGPALWADVELFSFEGAPYRSPLIEAPRERVKKQLDAVEPYVDKILVYQYQVLGVTIPETKTEL